MQRPDTSYEASTTARLLFLSAKWIQFLLPAIILAVTALAAAANFVLKFETPPYMLQILLSLLAVYVILAKGLSRLLYWINQVQAHARRTRHAFSIYSDLEAERKQQFCLYLRPFLSTKGLRVPNSHFRRRFLPSMDHFYGSRVDLETVFAMALERRAHPLIAIGETGFNLGAGKIQTTERDWESAFQQLAESATAIIMVPLPRPSTLWELEFIIGNPALLQKALFIMPMRLRLGVREQLEPFWAEMHERLRSNGVDFPPLNPRGGLFRLSDGGTLLHIIDSGRFDIDYIDQVLQGLINRAKIETIWSAMSQQGRAAVQKLLEAFVYVSPLTGILRARPLPRSLLDQLDGIDSSLHVLSSHGFCVSHRSQDGAQAWWEVHLHPALLDWPRLKEWVGANDQELRWKGALIEATTHSASVLVHELEAADKSTLSVGLLPHGSQTLVRPPSLTSPAKFEAIHILRPEELKFAGRALSA